MGSSITQSLRLALSAPAERDAVVIGEQRPTFGPVSAGPPPIDGARAGPFTAERTASSARRSNTPARIHWSRRSRSVVSDTRWPMPAKEFAGVGGVLVGEEDGRQPGRRHERPQRFQEFVLTA